MGTTKATDLISLPELAEAIPAAFAARDALLLEQLGAATVVPGLADLAQRVVAGLSVQIPYYGTIPDFQDLAENVTMTVQSLAQTSETALIERWGNAVGITDLASRVSHDQVNTEAARQLVAAAMRKIDDKLIAKAIGPGAAALPSVWNAGAPVTITYDNLVDLGLAFEDEIGPDDIAAYTMHPKTFADLLKLKDTQNRPLLSDPGPNAVPRLFGKPIVLSGKMTSGGAMGTVTSTGTTPPTVGVSGTPNGRVNKLQINITVGGTLGTAKFKFSTDGGNTFSAELTTGASVLLTDTAVDSLVGKNGVTGITAAFGAGTYATDNVYKSTAARKMITAAIRRNALVAIVDLASLSQPEINRRPLDGAEDLVVNVYGATHRYRRVRGGTTVGVSLLEHN